VSAEVEILMYIAKPPPGVPKDAFEALVCECRESARSAQGHHATCGEE